MKKNSCTPINPKKYSCYGLKKIDTRNLITKKYSCVSKIPHPPNNFPNGPSLKTVGIWQYCFSNHSSKLKVSPHLVSRYRSYVRRQSYRGPSDAVAGRVEEIWIGLKGGL